MVPQPSAHTSGSVLRRNGSRPVSAAEQPRESDELQVFRQESTEAREFSSKNGTSPRSGTYSHLRCGRQHRRSITTEPLKRTATSYSRSKTPPNRSSGDRPEPSAPFGTSRCNVCDGYLLSFGELCEARRDEELQQLFSELPVLISYALDDASRSTWLGSRAAIPCRYNSGMTVSPAISHSGSAPGWIEDF